MNVACVLLAAGAGTRMGGNKLLTGIEGKTLISRAASLAAALPFSERVAVVRPEDDAVRSAVQKEGIRTVSYPAWGSGIASSLVTGLSAVTGAAPDGVLFLVCDQPRLTEKTIMHMLALFEAEPNAIIRPCSEEGRPGNPVLFPKRLFRELSALSGDTGGKTVVQNHPELVRTVICNEEELADIDSPADIVKAIARKPMRITETTE